MTYLTASPAEDQQLLQEELDAVNLKMNLAMFEGDQAAYLAYAEIASDLEERLEELEVPS